jgi:hypothetical protein
MDITINNANIVNIVPTTLDYLVISITDINEDINENINVNLEVNLENCTICHEIKNNEVTLFCNHSFCTECIRIWIREQPTCPLCRESIIHTDIVNITLEGLYTGYEHSNYIILFVLIIILCIALFGNIFNKKNAIILNIITIILIYIYVLIYVQILLRPRLQS